MDTTTINETQATIEGDRVTAVGLFFAFCIAVGVIAGVIVSALT